MALGDTWMSSLVPAPPSAPCSLIDAMTIPVTQRTPEVEAYLADEVRKRREETQQQYKRNRAEMVRLAAQLLEGDDDPYMTEWLTQQKVHVAKMITNDEE